MRTIFDIGAVINLFRLDPLNFPAPSLPFVAPSLLDAPQIKYRLTHYSINIVGSSEVSESSVVVPFTRTRLALSFGVAVVVFLCLAS